MTKSVEFVEPEHNNLFYYLAALTIRRQFEIGVINENKLQSLYEQYNHIDNSRLFIERANRLFPRLNCGLTSIYLQHVFKQGEIIQGAYGAKPHTFLRLKTGYIADITSDQYGGPKVYVGPLKEPWQVLQNQA